MNETIYVLVFVLIVLGIGLALPSLKNQKPKQDSSDTTIDTPTDTPEDIQINPKPNYSQSYQAKYLLTKNEWYEYKKLRQYAESHGLQVCPKVRLLDIVEPRRGTNNYMSLLGKIQSKHVDFVICDQNLYIKAILELDDNSHNRADRQERDQFVDEILTSVGYKVIRTRSITEDTLKPLTNEVRQTETKQV